MFWVVKKRYIILTFLLIVLVVSGVVVSNIRTEYVYLKPSSKFTVVIDAGHGGIDGGSVGTSTGVYESDLNLKYAKNLAKQLNEMNISVIMTRLSNDGLYENSAKSLKKSDMKKRKQIIDESNADLVVSIHMNSYPLSSCRGAQAFYKKENESGKALADNIQKQFCQTLNNAKKTSLVGDYYLVNCTELPSVIVECGFLSNKEEEKLLISNDYQNKVCYAIACGIIGFLNQNSF